MSVIFPYLDYLGPAWFRRILLDLIPVPKVQNVKRIVDTIHERSNAIFQAKKAAIERGDQEILHMVGEGKDVMSILRTWPHYFQLSCRTLTIRHRH